MNVQRQIANLLAGGRHVVVESTTHLDPLTDAVLLSTDAVHSHFATHDEAMRTASQLVPDDRTSFYVLDPQPVMETTEFNLF